MGRAGKEHGLPRTLGVSTPQPPPPLPPAAAGPQALPQVLVRMDWGTQEWELPSGPESRSWGADAAPQPARGSRSGGAGPWEPVGRPDGQRPGAALPGWGGAEGCWRLKSPGPFPGPQRDLGEPRPSSFLRPPAMPHFSVAGSRRHRPRSRSSRAGPSRLSRRVSAPAARLPQLLLRPRSQPYTRHSSLCVQVGIPYSACGSLSSKDTRH